MKSLNLKQFSNYVVTRFLRCPRFWFGLSLEAGDCHLDCLFQTPSNDKFQYRKMTITNKPFM